MGSTFKFNMSHLTNNTVLSLNANWQAIEVVSPQKAFHMMATGNAVGLDTHLGNLSPIEWEKWIQLPCEEEDDTVKTVRGDIRIPRVIIAVNYDRLRPKTLNLTIENLAELQGYKCAYTNKQLTRKNWSLDHVIPVSKGGKTEWINVVAADKDINSKKSDKTPEEAGLKLLSKPRVPKKMMPSELIRRKHVVKFKEWEMFIKE